MNNIIHQLKNEVHDVLTQDILPYWMKRMVDTRGGFYGRINGTEDLIPDADKGAILNARILWTYSAAYRLLRKEEYLKMATRAKRVIINDFYDKSIHRFCFPVNFS